MTFIADRIANRSYGKLFHQLEGGTMKRSAIFDKNKRYRYQLKRIWDKDRPSICWILLNPGLMGDDEEDETVSKCIEYSQKWGYGSLILVNLFAYRSAYIKDLLESSEPVGEENDQYIIEASRQSDRTLLAWGGSGNFMNRNQHVLKQLDMNKTYCLKVLIDGNPAHPLLLPQSQEPILFDQSGLVIRKRIA